MMEVRLGRGPHDPGNGELLLVCGHPHLAKVRVAGEAHHPKLILSRIAAGLKVEMNVALLEEG
jgi:hypothetical protein